MIPESVTQKVAERYRAEGYAVALRPADGAVPPAAAGLHFDLLATKGGENVLVRIKENRADLRDDPESARAAEVINAEPGWRFDLVVLNGGSAGAGAAEGPEPSVDAVLQNLDAAERSARAGDRASSFLLAWASLEAAMRRAARAAGIDLPNIAPAFLLRALYSNGLLEKSEFDQLTASLRLRNVVAHGLETPDFDESPSLFVAATARKLLALAGQEGASR